MLTDFVEGGELRRVWGRLDETDQTGGALIANVISGSAASELD